jgi:purine catabolism regulator
MLTLGEILELDVVRRGQPRVVAGSSGLDAQVRWVHAMELTDVGRLLRGGELVLSTGIALPDSPSGLASYVIELAGAGASGLAIELGRRYSGELPAALAQTASAAGLPLIAFEREVPFVEITEAVHSRIIDDQLAELRAAQTVHQTFTELSVAGAPAEAIVAAAARLAGRPVVLADLSHRVLACSARDVQGVLDDFASRARLLTGPRTFYAEDPGWLVTTVGARGEDWGRLYLVCEAAPDPVDTVLIERAATTLALGRLLTRQAESLERQAHRTLIAGLLAGDAVSGGLSFGGSGLGGSGLGRSGLGGSGLGGPGLGGPGLGGPGLGGSGLSGAAPGGAAEAEARARALGVPVTGRSLVAAVVRIPDSGPGISAHAAVLAAAEAVAEACRTASVPALVGSLDDVRAGALLSLPLDSDPDAMLDAVAARLRDRITPGFVIGAGAATGTLREARQSMIDAREVADVAFRDPDGRPWYRLPDLRLRGLLHLLRDDARLQAFAERELGALLAYDTAHSTDLVHSLAIYLECGGNKASAAQQAHLARPTFYQRLRLVEHILGVDLSAAESRTSLHVALLARSAT